MECRESFYDMLPCEAFERIRRKKPDYKSIKRQRKQRKRAIERRKQRNRKNQMILSFYEEV